MNKNHEDVLEKLENEIITRSKSYTYHKEYARAMAKKDIEIERMKEYVSDARKEKIQNRKLKEENEKFKEKIKELEFELGGARDEVDRGDEIIGDKNEEIEELKNQHKLEIEKYYKVVSDAIDKIKEKDKEIDDLSAQIDFLNEYHEEDSFCSKP